MHPAEKHLQQQFQRWKKSRHIPFIDFFGDHTIADHNGIYHWKYNRHKRIKRVRHKPISVPFPVKIWDAIVPWVAVCRSVTISGVNTFIITVRKMHKTRVNAPKNLAFDFMICLK